MENLPIPPKCDLLLFIILIQHPQQAIYFEYLASYFLLFYQEQYLIFLKLIYFHHVQYLGHYRQMKVEQSDDSYVLKQVTFVE